jgi:hypothetical protein
MVTTALFAVALFVSLVGFVASQGIVGAQLRDIAQPIATLIAGIGGLFMIAWQTRKGFHHLKAGQDHRAGLDREARVHQAELERESEALALIERRAGLEIGIKAEVLANAEAAYYLISALKITYEVAEQFPSASQYLDIDEIHQSRLIYETNISELSLHNPRLSADVIAFYALIDRRYIIRRNRQEETYEQFVTLIDTRTKWASSIIMVAERILGRSIPNPIPTPKS